MSYGEEEITSSIDKTDSNDITDPNIGLGVGYLAGTVLGSSLTLELMLARQAEDLTSIMIGANATF